VAAGYGQSGPATSLHGAAEVVGEDVGDSLGRMVVDLDGWFARWFRHDSIMARFAVPLTGYSCQP